MNLSERVREVLDNSELTDPGDVAEVVIDDFDEDEIEGVLPMLMRAYVRNVMSSIRCTPPPSPSETPRPAGKSWKGQAIRESWKRHLTDRLHIEGQWKMLRDCTAADLTLAADERRIKAEQNAAWAAEYERYAAAIREAGVARFADLPTETQETLLSRR